MLNRLLNNKKKPNGRLFFTKSPMMTKVCGHLWTIGQKISLRFFLRLEMFDFGHGIKPEVVGGLTQYFLILCQISVTSYQEISYHIVIIFLHSCIEFTRKYQYNNYMPC